MTNTPAPAPRSRQRTLYAMLDFASHTRSSFWFNGMIILLILLSVPLTILQTFSDLRPDVLSWARVGDICICSIFLLEYILRIYTAPLTKEYAEPFWGRIRFALTPLMIIDLLAVFPGFLVHSSLLKFLRIFRVLKLARYSDAVNILVTVFKKRRFELLMSGSFILMLWVWSSFLIYKAEHEAQPLVFQSMLDAVWWSAVTFTTVGYGDIYPVTWIGKALAVGTIFMGIAIFSISTSILTASILHEIRKDEQRIFK